MRAGYLVVALAVLVAALLGGLAGWLGGPEPGPGPIAVALGLAGREAPDLERRRAQAVADATASCMAAQGLSYPAVAAAAPTIPDAELGPLDWAARWGFGVSTSVGAPVAAADRDPAAAWLAALDARKRTTFARALYGDGSVPGCQAAATDAVYGLRTRALAPIAADLAQVETAIDADRATVAVRSRWQACVAGLVTELGATATPLARSTLPGLLLARFAERTDAVRTDPSALAGLQEAERRTAVTMARCEAAFARERARVAERHEAAYVARHGAELARVASIIAAAEAAYPSVAP
jgi:hypothetical protein